MADCCGERLVVECPHVPSSFEVNGADFAHVDGEGKRVEGNICDAIEKECNICDYVAENCPPPELDVTPGPTGCCTLTYDGESHRLGATYEGVQAPRGPAIYITAATPLGPLPGTELCATIDAGCCGGVIRADHIHSLSARDGFRGLVATQPQWQLDGGAWANFVGAGRDELAVIGTPALGLGELSENEFFDTAFITVGPGVHTVCARLDYTGNGPFPITQGGVDDNAATLYLSTVHMRCC